MELITAQVHRTRWDYIDVSNIDIMTQIKKVFLQHHPYHYVIIYYFRDFYPLGNVVSDIHPKPPELHFAYLETDAAKAVEWFDKNQTTTNADKFQSILLSRRNVDDFDIFVVTLFLVTSH